MGSGITTSITPRRINATINGVLIFIIGIRLLSGMENFYRVIKVQPLFCPKRVRPWVFHDLNAEFAIESFPAKTLGFFMFGMITPLTMGFRCFKFDDGNTFTIRGGERFNGNETRYLLD
jgi:hypothetical protein